MTLKQVVKFGLFSKYFSDTLFVYMNKKNNKENNVETFVNRKVIVKFVNGRTISGFLKNEDEVFTIKLGVKHIVVNPTDVVRVTELI